MPPIKYAKLLKVLTRQRTTVNAHTKAGLTDLVEMVMYDKGEPSLKMVAKYEKLSCHIARHTYATLSLSWDVSVEVLQKRWDIQVINRCKVWRLYKAT